MSATLQQAEQLHQTAHRYGFAYMTAENAVYSLGQRDGTSFLDFVNSDAVQDRLARTNGDRAAIQSILSEHFGSSVSPAQRAALDAWVNLYETDFQLENAVRAAGGSDQLYENIISAATDRQDISLGGVDRSGLNATDEAVLGLVSLRGDQDRDGRTAASLIAAYNAANPSRAIHVEADGIDIAAGRSNEAHADFARIVGEMKQDIGALRDVNFDANNDGQISLSELNTAIIRAVEVSTEQSQSR